MMNQPNAVDPSSKYYIPAMALQFTSTFTSLPLSVERTMGRVGKKENNVLREKIISGGGARARQAAGGGHAPPTSRFERATLLLVDVNARSAPRAARAASRFPDFKSRRFISL